MAVQANITIDQGTTFNTSISMTDASNNPLDLSVYIGRAQIRAWYTSLTPAALFTVTLLLGSATLSLTATQTAALNPGRYVYDLVVIDQNDIVTRIIQGVITITPAVTVLADFN